SRAELLDFLTVFEPAVNHDSISTRCYVCFCSRNGFLNTFSGYECLDPGDYHEVFGYLRLLSCHDLRREALNGIQKLLHLGTEQRVPLSSNLILNDNSGYP